MARRTQQRVLAAIRALREFGYKEPIVVVDKVEVGPLHDPNALVAKKPAARKPVVKKTKAKKKRGARA